MPVHNSDVARIFNQVADLLDIEGANRFRVRAYREAAGTVSRLSRNVADMVAAGEDLSELPDIGEDLAAKIEEIVRTGTLEQLAEIERRTPPELANLLDIEGLGPKRVRKLHEELGIVTMEDVEQAARAGKIRQAVSTDAHTPNDLDTMRYGIGQARRGWLTAGDVLNTRRWTELRQLLQR